MIESGSGIISPALLLPSALVRAFGGGDVNDGEGAGVKGELAAFGIGSAPVAVPGDHDLVSLGRNRGGVGSHGNEAEGIAAVGMEKGDDLADSGFKIVLHEGRAVAVTATVGTGDKVKVAPGFGIKIDRGDVVLLPHDEPSEGAGAFRAGVKLPQVVAIDGIDFSFARLAGGGPQSHLGSDLLGRAGLGGIEAGERGRDPATTLAMEVEPSGGRGKDHGPVGTGIIVVEDLLFPGVVSEELHPLHRAVAIGGAGIEDEAFGIELAGGQALVGKRGVGHDLAASVVGMAAQDPGALETVLRNAGARASTMGGKVEPPVGPQGQAGVNLARSVVGFGHADDALDIGEETKRFGGGVVGVDEGVAARGEVVANAGVVGVPHGEAIAPNRPRIAGVALAVEVEEIDGGRGFGDGDAVLEFARWLEPDFGAKGRDRLAIRKDRGPCQFPGPEAW